MPFFLLFLLLCSLTVKRKILITFISEYDSIVYNISSKGLSSYVFASFMLI